MRREAPRSLKPSINSLSPSSVHFIVGLFLLYRKSRFMSNSDRDHLVGNISNKNKYLQTTSEAVSFIPDNEIRIINNYIM